jgi:fumarylacetoacetase
VAYHSRASSVVPSGTPVRRPNGQRLIGTAQEPTFGPCTKLDFELELGIWIGAGNAWGEPIPIGRAGEHIAGLCLVNDWSARDIQRWEYQPLGPFLAKSFASTVSPWVVTMDALAPFRVPAAERPAGDPAPLPYLTDPSDRSHGGIDLTLEVYLSRAQMRAAGLPAMRLSRAQFRSMYWTVAQMLTHHASNGCNLRPGDLLGSGTVSGPAPGNRGCLLELAGKGAEPVRLPTRESRRFLEDGDEVILRGFCERDGYARVGFGDCRGVVLAA